MADSYRQPTHAGGPRPTFGGGSRPNLEPQNWSSLFSDEQAVEKFPVPPFARLVGQVFFQVTASDALDDEDEEMLRDLALTCSIIEKEEPLRFWFVGLADYRGSRSYNKALGLRRATNTGDFFRAQLSALQPANSRIFFHYKSWGESRPQQPELEIHERSGASEGSRHRTGKKRTLASTANWRRVDIYVNIPRGDFEQAEKNVKKLRKRLQKWAGQALRRHRQAILDLGKQAEKYKTRTLNPAMLKGELWSAGLVYLDNALILDGYVAWLKEMQERYLDLQRALEQGDSAFLEWDKKWFGDRSKGQQRLQRMRDLQQKLSKRLETATEEEKRALQNIVEALDEEVRTYAEELKHSKLE